MRSDRRTHFSWDTVPTHIPSTIGWGVDLTSHKIYVSIYKSMISTVLLANTEYCN